jgi:membrane protein
MWNKVKSGASFSYDILTAAAYEYGVDRVSRMSAAVAYRTIFALAPLFIVAVGVFGAIVGDDDQAKQQILEAIERFAGEEVSDALITFLGTFLTTAVEFGDAAAVVGVVLLLWTISSLFFEVQNDLNDIFHVPYEKTAGVWGFVKKRGIGFMWGLGLGLALLAVWLLNVTWQFFEGLFPEDLVAVHGVIGWIAPVVSLLMLPLLFGLLIQTLTMTTVRWRATWFGAIFISLGFLLAAYGTGLYFAWEEGTSALTVAGSFFVVLLMAYVLSTVFLYGAVVVKVYHDYLEAGDVESPSIRHVRANAYRPEVVVAEPSEPAPLAAVFGFLAGLLVGWRKTRR